MKCKCLILAVFSVSFILFSQMFQEDAFGAEGPKPAVKTVDSEKPVLDAAKPVKKAEDQRLSPKIVFDNLVHDFGIIDPKSKNTCEFKFTNKGLGVLKIDKKITATCGCTVPQLTKEGYAPGESGVIKLTYTAGKAPGATTKRIHAHTNDKNNTKVSLTIKAKIELQVKCTPAKMELLLKKENANSPEITIQSVDGEAFAITKFDSTGKSITADFDPSQRKSKYVIKPKVDISKLQKHLNGTIQIKIDHPRCGSVSVPFSTLSEYKIVPSSTIVLMNTKPEEAVEREVWIYNNYEQEVQIESLTSKNGIIKVMEKKKDGNRYKLALEIVPPAIKGKKRLFTDDLIVKMKDGNTLNIKCRGFYKRNRTKSKIKS